MTTARTLLLALLLLAPLQSPASATPATAATPELAPAGLRVAQTHGHVAQPTKPAGYSLSVRGAPGTRYEVFTTEEGGAPVLVGSGTIPAGGSITLAVWAPGLPSSPPRAKVLVSSRATARVQVVLAYL